ncbi:hypothetical protein A2U01_0106548, partial [Trifolium medium]|nr:hypothetical protein [Trifolium medium]
MEGVDENGEVDLISTPISTNSPNTE